MSISGFRKFLSWGGDIYWKLKYTMLSRMNNVGIPPFVFGKGLMIPHLQNIVVSSQAKVGEYCCLFHNTTIGISVGRNDRGECPTLANGVTICSGAGLFGNITIANGVTIGANAVVTKSFTEQNCVVGGNPARIIGFEAGFQMLKFKEAIKER